MAGLTVPAKVDELVWAHLGALVAHDTSLRPGLRLDLQTQDSAEPRCDRPTLFRVLKGKRRLWRVLQREPHALEEVDEEDRLEELRQEQHRYPRSSTIIGSVCPAMITFLGPSTVLSLRILS